MTGDDIIRIINEERRRQSERLRVADVAAVRWLRVRRVTIIAFAMALLVVFAQPAAAADAQLEVGSQHTTDTDFNNAKLLTNLAVSGSGESASLELDGLSVIDSAEDADIDEYGGYTGNISVTSTTSTDGSYSIEHTTDGAGKYEVESSSGLNDYPQSGDTFKVDVKISDSNDLPRIRWATQGSTGTGYGVQVANANNNIEFLVGGSKVKTATLGSTMSTGQWYTFTIQWGGGGQMQVTVNDSSGSEIASISYTDTTYSSGGIAFGHDNQHGQSTSAYFDYWRFGTKKAEAVDSAQYLSANHSVSNVKQLSINLTLSNASATVEAQYWDGSQWQVANSSTYSTTGNYTLDVSGHASAVKWRTNVTYFGIGSSPTAQMHDETYLFQARDPDIDDSSAIPTGDLKQAKNTFEIDISDPDFDTAQGDTVTAELFVDGSSIGTDTLTSNGTVSVTTTISGGGDHSYYWEASDDYGDQVTSSTFSVSTPANITLRKESDPDTLVTDAQANITAYYDGQVITRNTSNGKLDLSGFPVDQPIMLRIAADGYYTRTIVIDNIYEQANAYLLNDSIAAYQARFSLEDPTGNYPDSDTVLFVERDLTLNGSTEWRIIAGDNIGIKGVPVDLVQDERYRIRIRNLETGTEAVLGSYTSIQDESVTLSPGSATIDVVDSEKNYSWSITENESAQHILFEYLDTASKTNSIKLTVHERYNASNVLVDNDTFSSNNLVYQIPMTQNETNKTWTAELYVDRGNGYQHFRVPIDSGGENILPVDLDPVWVQGVGVFIVLITGMAFSQLNQGVGAITTSLVGGLLWYLGVLSGVAIGAAVALSIVIAVVYHYAGGGTAQGGMT